MHDKNTGENACNNYFERMTAAPRPRLSVRAAFPLFTPISRYPLDPTYAIASPLFPRANVSTSLVMD